MSKISRLRERIEAKQRELDENRSELADLEKREAERAMVAERKKENARKIIVGAVVLARILDRESDDEQGRALRSGVIKVLRRGLSQRDRGRVGEVVPEVKSPPPPAESPSGNVPAPPADGSRKPAA